MATVKGKTFVVQKMHSSNPTHARSDVFTRDLEVVIDEPTERGGTNLGFSPTETVMAALIGCTNVISRRIAHGMGVEFEDVTIDMDADFDRRGVLLQDEVETPFPEVRMTINVTTSATDEEMARIQADLAKFCPLAKMFRGSGTKLVETWNVTRK